MTKDNSERQLYQPEAGRLSARQQGTLKLEKIPLLIAA